jgi:hypothetical protein
MHLISRVKLFDMRRIFQRAESTSSAKVQPLLVWVTEMQFDNILPLECSGKLRQTSYTFFE